MNQFLLLLSLILPFLFLLYDLSRHLYFDGTRCPSAARMDGKTVIITGANTGIGRATAMDLAKRGARVVLACRNETRTAPALKEIRAVASPDRVIFMALDLSSFASVRRFSEEFRRREMRLDVLVNNAGLVGRDEVALNEDGIEMGLFVNHLAHFYLTNLLLDLLKSSGPGSRIVTVSSKMYNFANPSAFLDFNSLRVDGTEDFPEELETIDLKSEPLAMVLPESLAKLLIKCYTNPNQVRYANSKLANILFTKELAKRLRGSGVAAFVVHPGMVATEIGLLRDDPNAPKTGFPPFTIFRKTPEQGAQTTICAVVSKDFEGQSGLYYDECRPFDIRRSEVLNEALAEKFWRWSQDVVDEVVGKE